MKLLLTTFCAAIFVTPLAFAESKCEKKCDKEAKKEGTLIAEAGGKKCDKKCDKEAKEETLADCKKCDKDKKKEGEAKKEGTLA
jgi:hypothetical protein